MNKKFANIYQFDSVGKNIFIQMVMCICVIIIILIVNINNTYFNYLNYDELYNKCATFLNVSFQFNIPLKELELENEKIPNLMENNNIVIEKMNNKIDINNEIEKIEEKVLINCNEMNEKAIKIKEKYNFIIPVSGVISCKFGNRVTSNSQISTFHLGVDIANSLNTKINSATDGVVLEIAENSIYGKFIKIKTDNITIIYAHCNKIIVKKGDSIKAGQNIALMGNTGLSTGTHLHFEIRDENNEVINPEYILEFVYEN